ncbi:transporter substrate-binding domain-containing protein [Halococcus saccharolyticus]|uniref:ABC-type glutamine/glutamate/polar amino acids transport system, substrate-binding protein n=1 Tax=Halococcus saccharolyticus DSM 5350 TaxID=1227455 RepID=M0MP63_9EURY|nr:transporter substrate-binding domain-containing protein [Halococcus saccharolyticus]EMA46504.1 ABC-type glutamine/glutamate/polar amino acids transport system, substrate-binding protein [Halococcus saccharolyticus DSM 5350]
MDRNDLTTRRGYLKATGAGVAALSLAGCVGGGGDGNGSGSGNESGDGGGGANGSGGGDGGNGSSDNASGGSGGNDTGGNESSGNESGDSAEQETIVIGSDIPYKPFEYRTNDDELVGFDVGIADAVFGEQLGMTPNFKATAFDTIIPSLNNGNFRVIMSAMTINDERAQKVDFSDPYFTAYQTIVVLQNSDISAKEDLKGKTVGVQKGTTGEGAAEALKEEFDGDLTIQSYDQIPGAFSALNNNQVVAVINDNTVNGQFVDENSDIARFVEGEGEAAAQGKNAPPYLTLTVEEYGIAFRKDDDDLKGRVNEALATIRDNGTYEEIYNEYFDA